MTYKDIMNIVPTVQAAGLVGHNLKQMNKKQSVKSMVGLGVTNIVGTSLIQSESKLIGSL
jgi:alkylated DNA nucleotide flippase Atl1